MNGFCQKTYRENRVATLKEKGLCVVCGKDRLESTSLKCRSCVATHRLASARARARNLENGLCVTCSLPSNGKAHCESCARKNSERSKALIAKRKGFGVCTYCGIEPPERNRSWCAPCLERDRKSRKALLERRKARCKDCNADIETGKQRCEICAEKHRTYQRNRNARKKAEMIAHNERLRNA